MFQMAKYRSLIVSDSQVLDTSCPFKEQLINVFYKTLPWVNYRTGDQSGSSYGNLA